MYTGGSDTKLEEKSIHTAYQPIYRLDSEGIYGYEGLAHLEDSSISSISELMGSIETDDKMQALNLHIMEQVIRNFKGDKKLFIPMIGSSAEATTEYLDRMIKVAQEVDFNLENLILELSERASWKQESIDTIREYKANYQFLLAIDNLGIGFSNNFLLLDIPADIVKIDKVFIKKIDKDRKKHATVRAFIEVIKNSNMKIFCNGIEEEAELKVVKTLGSDLGQGYYLGKPII